MIQVKVDRMFLSNMGFVVVLKGEGDPRSLPIFIGAAEAHAIALWMNKVEIPRPMTHDLLKNILDCAECRLHRVEVTRLEEGTFFASIVLDIGGEETHVDARPSDAIALALRTKTSIYVNSAVMDEAGKVLEGQEEHVPESPPTIDKFKADLEQAIAEERYEDAAQLRDQIRVLERNSTKN